MFDLEMIRAVYGRFPGRVAAVRQATGKALTLAEKILYTHLWDGEAKTAFTRGADYVDFAPDRVAMQDATAQMALQLPQLQSEVQKMATALAAEKQHVQQYREDVARLSKQRLARSNTWA